MERCLLEPFGHRRGLYPAAAGGNEQFQQGPVRRARWSARLAAVSAEAAVLRCHSGDVIERVENQVVGRRQWFSKENARAVGFQRALVDADSGRHPCVDRAWARFFFGVVPAGQRFEHFGAESAGCCSNTANKRCCDTLAVCPRRAVAPVQQSAAWCASADAKVDQYGARRALALLGVGWGQVTFQDRMEHLRDLARPFPR